MRDSNRQWDDNRQRDDQQPDSFPPVIQSAISAEYQPPPTYQQERDLSREGSPTSRSDGKSILKNIWGVICLAGVIVTIYETVINDNTHATADATTNATTYAPENEIMVNYWLNRSENILVVFNRGKYTPVMMDSSGEKHKQ